MHSESMLTALIRLTMIDRTDRASTDSLRNLVALDELRDERWFPCGAGLRCHVDRYSVFALRKDAANQATIAGRAKRIARERRTASLAGPEYFRHYCHSRPVAAQHQVYQ